MIKAMGGWWLLGGLILLSACQNNATPIVAPITTTPEEVQMQKRGFQKVQGEWMADEELKGFILDENGITKDFTQLTPPVGLCMTVAIKYDATPADLEKLKKGLQRFSQLLWNDTWGNMYVKKALLKNNVDKNSSSDAPKGYLTLEKLAREQGGHAYFGGVITVGVQLLDIQRPGSDPDLGLRIFGAGILHEFNHSMFHLPDEYPYKGQPKTPVKKCVMDPRSHVTTLCTDCEQIILGQFKKFRFPVTEEPADWAKQHPVPETYFVVK